MIVPDVVPELEPDLLVVGETVIELDSVAEAVFDADCVPETVDVLELEGDRVPVAETVKLPEPVPLAVFVAV